MENEKLIPRYDIDGEPYQVDNIPGDYVKFEDHKALVEKFRTVIEDLLMTPLVSGSDLEIQHAIRVRERATYLLKETR